MGLRGESFDGERPNLESLTESSYPDIDNTVMELDQRCEGLVRINDGTLECGEDGVYSPSRVDSVKAKLYRNRIYLLCVGLLLVVLVLVVVGSVVPAVVLTRGGENSSNSSNDERSSNEEYHEVPPEPEDEQVRTSSEYQITLDNYEDWVDRDLMVQMYLDVVNQNEFMDVDFDDGFYSARVQYQLLTTGVSRCNQTREIRVREYISGFGEGSSYTDIKSSSKTKSSACDVPFWPADPYQEQSRQKCEEDIHECEIKYSRESRIFFDEFQSLETCHDLLVLYPWAFENLSEENQFNTVKQSGYGTWWTALFTGVMDEDTNYEMAFTLEYDDESGAIIGNVAPHYGEWSIRIYTLDDGLTNVWNEDARDACNEIWTNITATFGNVDNFGC